MHMYIYIYIVFELYNLIHQSLFFSKGHHHVIMSLYAPQDLHVLFGQTLTLLWKISISNR